MSVSASESESVPALIVQGLSGEERRHVKEQLDTILFYFSFSSSISRKRRDIDSSFLPVSILCVSVLSIRLDT